MTSTQQPRRRPQGTPAGGQFAPAPHHPTPGRDALAGAARVRGVTSAFAAAKADEAGRAQDYSLGEAEARLRSATSATLSRYERTSRAHSLWSSVEKATRMLTAFSGPRLLRTP